MLLLSLIVLGSIIIGLAVSYPLLRRSALWGEADATEAVRRRPTEEAPERGHHPWKEYITEHWGTAVTLTAYALLITAIIWVCRIVLREYGTNMRIGETNLQNLVSLFWWPIILSSMAGGLLLIKRAVGGEHRESRAEHHQSSPPWVTLLVIVGLAVVLVFWGMAKFREFMYWEARAGNTVGSRVITPAYSQPTVTVMHPPTIVPIMSVSSGYVATNDYGLYLVRYVDTNYVARYDTPSPVIEMRTKYPHSETIWWRAHDPAQQTNIVPYLNGVVLRVNGHATRQLDVGRYTFRSATTENIPMTVSVGKREP